MLKWARENGCPWSPTVCARAAAVGNVEALQWLREKGCPWNYLVWSSAVAGYHVEVLKWAKEVQCPEMPRSLPGLFTLAAERGHLDVLDWFYQEGMLTGPKLLEVAKSAGDLHVQAWASKRVSPGSE